MDNADLMKVKRSKKKNKDDHFGDEGSENAPEDSGFLSDDGD